MTWMGGILLAVAAIASVVALSTARGVAAPVDEMARSLECLASGQLGTRVEAAGTNELGRMGAAFNATAAELQEILDSEQVSWADVAKGQAETARLKQMVQQAPVPMLFADGQNVVRYQNEASRHCL